MKILVQSILLFVFTSSMTVKSQQITQPDSLLNKLTGKWLLKGKIAGQETVHDIDAERVLNGEYL